MLSYFVLQLIVAVAAFGVVTRLLATALHGHPRLELFLRRLFLIRYSLLAAALLLAWIPTATLAPNKDGSGALENPWLES
jgi:hypothetical protein